MSDVFGELSSNAGYASSFTDALSSRWSRGVRATLEEFVQA